MTQASPEPLRSFAYKAQGSDGAPLSGTIDATGVEQARRQIESLGLRITEMAPSERAPSAGRPLSNDDFIAFNRQLGYLTSAGLPMEGGLRLIADDMRSGRLATTIRAVAADLESGKSLTDVFERHRGRFPSAYGRLLEAGVRSSSLPGVLFNLARHLELMQRLRGMIWRTISYPLMVLGGLAILLIFLGIFVLPRFREIFFGFKVALPAVTQLLLSLSVIMPAALIAILALILLSPLIVLALRRMGWDGPAVDMFVLRMPLVGPIVQRSLIAGWCDALRIGVEAGLDLPSAIQLAGDTCSSPALRADGHLLDQALSEGKTAATFGRGRVLPATVPAAINLGTANHDLPAALKGLCDLYHQQTEARLNTLPGILTPLLFLLLAGIVCIVMAGLVLPMVSLISAVSGGN